MKTVIHDTYKLNLRPRLVKLQINTRRTVGNLKKSSKT